jgi:Family of unknown function (DUF5947)
MTGETGLRRFVRPPAAAPAGPAEPEQAISPLVASMLSTPGRMAGPQAPVPPLAAPQLNMPLPGSDLRAGREDRQAAERCEMCGTAVPSEHGHIADLEAASLLCGCRACYLLFTQEGASRGRYRAVPDRYLVDFGRVMTAARWDELEIPVGLAFFLRTSRPGSELTGFYPSPAGATECRLDLQLWDRLTEDFPLLGEPVPDVEAALISRANDGVEYYLVPIDACYELAGRMRLNWHGFDGGTEARQSIAEFLAGLRQRARPYRAATAGRADAGG